MRRRDWMQLSPLSLIGDYRHCRGICSPRMLSGLLRRVTPPRRLARGTRGILLLLARLGLRAGDIFRLRLGDIDWKEAGIRVAGKGRRQASLPLTQEIGDAIVAYIKDGRPQTDSDTLFIRSRAPFRALANHLRDFDGRYSSDAPGGRHLPEPGRSPCAPAFHSKLDAPARRVAAGDRLRSPAPFDCRHGDL